MAEAKSGGRSRASAGMPDSMADARIAELEERLAALEGGPGLKERGRRAMDSVMPPDASKHFFNAGREHLLGMRSIVDFWLGRLDAMESKVAPDADASRESISID